MLGRCLICDGKLQQLRSIPKRTRYHQVRFGVNRPDRLLVEAGRDDILLIGGGIIPEDDIQSLEAEGIGKLVGPGATTQEIIDYIIEWAAGQAA